MARYRGPKAKIARRFKEPIFGPSKAFERKKYGPGQHGRNRRSKQSNYAVQLTEKQKAKYTYGLLEKQFRNLFVKATRRNNQTFCSYKAACDFASHTNFKFIFRRKRLIFSVINRVDNEKLIF